MSGLVVDVLFRDKVLETVPFDRPTLRVGRMPENDLVIDNLAVSRFHARLHIEERRVFLEDAGSENGCLVNDERVSGRREIAPGDRIQIGKHELRVRSAAADDGRARRASRRKSDGFDGARTYLVGMQPGPSLASAPEEPAPPVAPAAQPKEEIPMSEKRSAPVSVPVGVVAQPSSPGHELDFDFVGTLGDEAEAAASPPSSPTTSLPTERMADVAQAPAAASPPTAPMHAGFIVQHQGKLERVVAWQKDQLVAGRSADCDVLLGVDEVSRRHARFERAGDRFEVCDLGSVNGTFVNGRRVDRQALQVGDVVQIEGFKLTFVLDRQPIDEMVAPPVSAPAASQPKEDTFAMTMLQEQMPHRPGFTEVLAKPGPGEERAPASESEAVAVALPEGDLFSEELDEVVPLEDEAEKPEAPAVPLRGSSRATSVQDLGRVSAPKLDERALVFELRVRVDLLPPALREAFEAVGTSEIVLPAELRLKP